MICVMQLKSISVSGMKTNVKHGAGTVFGVWCVHMECPVAEQPGQDR